METRICKACLKEKQLKDFYRHSGENYMSKCKRCFIDKVKIHKEKKSKKSLNDYMVLNGTSKQDYMVMYELMERVFGVDLRHDIHEQFIKRWEERYNVPIVKKKRLKYAINSFLPDGSHNPEYPSVRKKKEPPSSDRGSTQ